MWSKVYLYRNGAISHPTGSSGLPWPVIFLLSRFNKKHIFGTWCKPDMEVVNQALVNVGEKLKWKYHFRKENSSYNPILAKMPKRAITLKCQSSTPPEIMAFCGEMKRAVLGIAKNSTCRPSCGYAVKRVFRFLKHEAYAAVLTGKDGGYLICLKTDIRDAHAKLLSGSDYTEVYETAIIRDKLDKEYRKIRIDCERISGIEGIQRKILTSNSPGSRVQNMLIVTAKTHKYFSGGALKWRNIHAAGGWAYRGLSIFLGIVLEHYLIVSCSHLCRDTREVVQRLQDTIPIAGDRLCAIDVEEFFMSGAPSELCSLVKGHWNQEALSCLRHATYFFLDCQYVISKYHLGKLWKVVRGSGMGLPHSGALADLCLHNVAEDILISKSRVESASIRAYMRFKDDILTLFHNFPAFKLWFEEYRSKAAPFKVKCEEISRYGIDYLESNLTLNSGSILFAPRVRASSLNAPLLDCSSRHHPNIHNTWPSGFLLRRLSLCSTAQARREEKQRVVSRFIESCAPTSVVNKLSNVQCNKQHVASSKVSLEQRSQPDGSDNSSNSLQHHNNLGVRIILPWHPGMQKAVAAVKRVTRQHGHLLSLVFGIDKTPKVSICWKNGQMNLKVQALAKDMSGKHSKCSSGSSILGGGGSNII